MCRPDNMCWWGEESCNGNNDPGENAAFVDFKGLGERDSNDFYEDDIGSSHKGGRILIGVDGKRAYIHMHVQE